MNQNDFQKIGFIVREKGLKGDVKISFEAFFLNYLSHKATPEYLFVLIHGSMIPYFIEKSNFKSQPITLKFEEVDDRQTAQKLRAKELFISKNLFKKDELPDDDATTYWNYILDYQVSTLHEQQLLGKVEDIFYLPEHELAQVFYQKKELLLPLNEEYIHEIDEAKKSIVFNLPKGFIEVFLS